MIRTSVEALAAVLGGTQSLHTNALDEAIALPSDFAARIARETQLYLQGETDLTRAIDPLGGSRHVEGLTEKLARKAWALIEEVERAGGMTKAIEEGLPKRRIEEAAARKQARLDSGQDVLVGVNRWRTSDEDEIDVLEAGGEAVRQAQVERLGEVKAARDDEDVQSALEALRRGAEGGREPPCSCRRGGPPPRYLGRDLRGYGKSVRAVPGDVRGGGRRLRGRDRG